MFSQNEQQNDFGINLYDFGARLSDPTTGNRFFQMDPLSEISRRFSPYIYARCALSSLGRLRTKNKQSVCDTVRV
jgi:hypothetical protein